MSGVKKKKTDDDTETIENRQNIERYSPKNLFQIAMEYVAVNAHYVETFEGFPDEVGRQIFKTAEEKYAFISIDNRSKQAMSKFTETYRELVLISLNLRRCNAALCLYDDHFTLFRHIQKLDVSFCTLGDDHDFLLHISQSLPNLKYLSMIETEITDKSLRLLAIPLGTNKNGLLNLEVLQIAGNKLVSDKGIRFIKKFKKLTNLDISDCNIQNAGVKEMRTAGFKQIMESVTNLSDRIENQGWAAKIVKDWSFIRPKSGCQSRVSQQGFYKNRNSIRGTSEDIAYIPTRELKFSRDNSLKTSHNHVIVSDDKPTDDADTSYESDLLKQYM